MVHRANYTGEKIRELRKNLGLTQERMAEQMYCARTVVTKLENGQRAPAYQDIISLCKVLQCTPNDLFRPDEYRYVPNQNNFDRSCSKPDTDGAGAIAYNDDDITTDREGRTQAACAMCGGSRKRERRRRRARQARASNQRESVPAKQPGRKPIPIKGKMSTGSKPHRRSKVTKPS